MFWMLYSGFKESRIVLPEAAASSFYTSADFMKIMKS